MGRSRTSVNLHRLHGWIYSFLVFSFILLVYIVVTTVPSLVFALYSSEKNSQVVEASIQYNRSLVCNVNVTSDTGFYPVEHDFLVSSVCRSYLPWMNDFHHDIQQEEKNFSSIIAVDNSCGLQRTEIDLKRLSNLIVSFNESCSSLALPLICSYFYRPAVNVTPCSIYWPTREQCKVVELVHCQSEWKVVAMKLRSGDYCIGLPDCRQLPGQQELDAVGFKTPRLPSEANVSQHKVHKTTSCRPPLLSSSSKYNNCSPPCPGEKWLVKKETFAILSAVSVLSGIVILTCSSIVVYTWIRVKQLREFPHTVTLLATISFVLPGLFLAVIAVVGRRAAYCSHDDLFNSWLHPTQFSVAQGAFFHFCYLVTLILFSMSIFNIMVAVYEVRKPDVEGILKRRSKLFLGVEVFFATGVAAAIVCAVLRTTSYQNDLLQVICMPRTATAYFYSFTLPSQVIGSTAFTMTLLIIKRMKQSSRFQAKEGAINKNVKAAGIVITRHFLFLVTVVPLVFVMAYTVLDVYSKFWSDEITRNITNYISCPQTNSSSDCISFVDEADLLIMYCITPVSLAVLVVSLMVYSLFPGPARKLWANHFKCFSCRRKAEGKTGNCCKVIYRKNDESRDKQMDEICSIDVGEEAKTGEKIKRKADNKSISETTESCLVRNNNTNICETEFNQNQSKFAAISNNNEYPETKIERKTPKRSMSLKELRKKADPVMNKLTKAATKSKMLKKSSSLQELFCHSQSN